LRRQTAVRFNPRSRAFSPLLREAVANRELADLADLEGRVRRRAQWLGDHPEVARGAVGFHWAVSIAG
jgi:hypothetical protein